MATYNPFKTSFSFNGYNITGFAPDTHIEVEFNGDVATSVTGNDGKHARAMNPDQSGTARIRLLATSGDNAILSRLVNADRINGDGTGSLLVKDNSGDRFAAGTEAYIQKPPPIAYANEVGVNEWTFFIGKLIQHEGGNVD